MHVSGFDQCGIARYNSGSGAAEKFVSGIKNYIRTHVDEYFQVILRSRIYNDRYALFVAEFDESLQADQSGLYRVVTDHPKRGTCFFGDCMTELIWFDNRDCSNFYRSGSDQTDLLVNV